MDYDKVDKKLTKIEQYWLNCDMSKKESVMGIQQQITEGRDKLVDNLVEKLPDKDTIKESIRRFREGDGFREDIENVVEESRQYIEMGKKHKTTFKIFKRMVGVQDGELYPLIRNQIEPTSVLLHLQIKKPEVYKILISEAGGFEYIKVLCMETLTELNDDIKELCENV